MIIIIVVEALRATAIFFWWQGTFGPSSPISDSWNLVTEEMEFSDFAIVEVGHAFKVEITQASSYSDNLFDCIEVSRTGDTLTIGLKSGYTYRPQWPWMTLTLRAVITMPELYESQLSRATQGTVEGFSSSHTFVLGLSGTSSLNGYFTTSGDAQFTISGASSTELDGAANDLTISADGASHLELSDFPVHNADVTLSGASRATINLDGRINADLSGASQLLYIGDPAVGDIILQGAPQ